MANRTFNDVQALDKQVKLLFGTVTFGASGVVASQQCLGFSVSKPAGTGLYRLQCEDSYPRVLSRQLQGQFAAATNGAFQLQGAPTEVTLADGRRVTQQDFQYVGAGVAADAPSGSAVDVMLAMKNTVVGP